MRNVSFFITYYPDTHLLSSFNCYIGITIPIPAGDVSVTPVLVLNFISIVFYLSLLLLILLRSKNHLTINRFLSILYSLIVILYCL